MEFLLVLPSAETGGSWKSDSPGAEGVVGACCCCCGVRTDPLLDPGCEPESMVPPIPSIISAVGVPWGM